MNNPFPPPPGYAVSSDCYWLLRSEAIEHLNTQIAEGQKRARAWVLSVTGLPNSGKTELLKQWKTTRLNSRANDKEVFVSISFDHVFDEGMARKSESHYSRRFLRQLWHELSADFLPEEEKLDFEASPTAIKNNLLAAVQRQQGTGCVYVVIHHFNRLFQYIAKGGIEGADFLDTFFSLLSDVYSAEPPRSYSVVYLLEDHRNLQDRLGEGCWGGDLVKRLRTLARNGGLLEWSMPALSYNETSQLLRCADKPADARVFWQDSFDLYRRIHDLVGGHAGLTSWLCWSIYAAQAARSHWLYLPQPLDASVLDHLRQPLKSVWQDYQSVLDLSEEDVEVLTTIARAARKQKTNCIRELDLPSAPLNLNQLLEKHVLETCVRDDRSPGLRLAIPLLGQILIEG